MARGQGCDGNANRYQDRRPDGAFVQAPGTATGRKEKLHARGFIRSRPHARGRIESHGPCWRCFERAKQRGKNVMKAQRDAKRRLAAMVCRVALDSGAWSQRAHPHQTAGNVRPRVELDGVVPRSIMSMPNTPPEKNVRENAARDGGVAAREKLPVGERDKILEPIEVKRTVSGPLGRSDSQRFCWSGRPAREMCPRGPTGSRSSCRNPQLQRHHPWTLAVHRRLGSRAALRQRASGGRARRVSR